MRETAKVPWARPCAASRPRAGSSGSVWGVGVALCALLAGCSGDDNGADGGGAFDFTIRLPEGYGPLWACTEPGKVCNAHDTCAIDPVCGPDHKCYPTRLMSCDDGLACTVDTCKGNGLCANTPKPGACALPVKVGGVKTDGGVVGGQTEIKCFNKGGASPTDPCLVCDPATSATRWTGSSGGYCDDGNTCTKDDACQNGLCKGTYFGSQCADSYGCTDDICDGYGGCVGNVLKKDWCLINGTCYKDKASHPSGTCKICDVSKGQNKWTDITNTCLISGKCYNHLEQHTGKCAICDTAKTTTAWTVTGSNCLISDVCKTDGDEDTTGCKVCDPDTTKTDWTTATSGKCEISGTCYKDKTPNPKGGCLICDISKDTKNWTMVTGASSVSYNFEGGALTGWTVSPLNSGVGWQVTNKRYASGSYALYYGNPTAGNYATGSSANSGSATLPAVTLTSGKKAMLTFKLYVDTESGSYYDKLTVYAGTTQVWVKDYATVPTMKVWQSVTVDLSTYAGQSVSIKLDFATGDGISNSTEGVYIDDLAIYHGC